MSSNIIIIVYYNYFTYLFNKRIEIQSCLFEKAKAGIQKDAENFLKTAFTTAAREKKRENERFRVYNCLGFRMVMQFSSQGKSMQRTRRSARLITRSLTGKTRGLLVNIT